MKILKRTLACFFIALVALLLVACKKTFKVSGNTDKIVLVGDSKGINLEKVKEGTELIFTVKEEDGKEVVVKVGDEELKPTDKKYKIKVDKDIKIVVEYNKPEPEKEAKLKIEQLEALYHKVTDEKIVSYEKDNLDRGYFAKKADNNDKKAMSQYVGSVAVTDKYLEDLKAFKESVKKELQQLTQNVKFKNDKNEDVAKPVKDLLVENPKLLEEKTGLNIGKINTLIDQLKPKLEAQEKVLEGCQIKGQLDTAKDQISSRQLEFMPVYKKYLLYATTEKGTKEYDQKTAFVKPSEGVNLAEQENYEQFAPKEEIDKIINIYKQLKEFLEVPTWENRKDHQEGDKYGESTIYTRKLDELKAKEAFKAFIGKIVSGTKPQAQFNSETDFGGTKITFYTHAGEDFFEDLLKTEKEKPEKELNKAAIKKFEAIQKSYQDLQTKQNFTLVFKQINEADLLTEVMNNIATGKASSILRIPQYNFWTNAIERGLLYDMHDFVHMDETNQIAGTKKDSVFNNWQVQRGQIKLGEKNTQFAIQRFDGQAHHDPFMYNETLLESVGLKPEEMPLQLWKDGKWTIDKMLEIAKKVQNSLSDADKKDATKRPVALSPQSIAWDGVAANGIDINNHIINDETTQNKYIEIINKYKPFVEQDLLVPEKRYYEKLDSNNKEYAKEGFNNMQDASRVFELGNNVFTASAGWQMGYINKHFVGKKLRVVPWPQLKVDKENYYSAVYEGDLLAVSKGKFAPEVANILLEINKAHKDNAMAELLESATLKYLGYKGKDIKEIEKELDYDKLLAYAWVYGRMGSILDDEKAVKDALEVLLYIRDPKHLRALPLQAFRSNFSLSKAVTKYLFAGGDFKDLLKEEEKDNTFKNDLATALSR